MTEAREINYPEHKHPHGVENTPPNEYRVWVCTECNHFFTDEEVEERRQSENVWGHSCKSHPCRKGQRCESHLEPFLPELGYRLVPELKVLSDKVIITKVKEAFKEDALLEHFVSSRGHWEKIVSMIAKAQLDYDTRQLKGSK